jgi:hypothetical protein
MRIVDTMQKADWPAIISRVAGVLVLLVGVLLATRLCVATTQPDKPVLCNFDSPNPCKLEVRR